MTRFMCHRGGLLRERGKRGCSAGASDAAPSNSPLLSRCAIADHPSLGSSAHGLIEAVARGASAPRRWRATPRGAPTKVPNRVSCTRFCRIARLASCRRRWSTGARTCDPPRHEPRLGHRRRARPAAGRSARASGAGRGELRPAELGATDAVGDFGGSAARGCAPAPGRARTSGDGFDKSVRG